MAEAFRDHLAAEGYRVLPYRSPELRYFTAAEPRRRELALAQIERTLALFEELKREDKPLKDTSSYLWRALRQLNLVPRPDVFDKIQDGDIVEIYSLEQELLFCNLQFFEICSFSLEEVFGLQWHRVTRRPERFAHQLWQLGMSMAQGLITETVDPGIEVHVVEEIDSPENHRMKLHVKYLSPLKRDGQPYAILVIQQTEVIGHAAATEAR
jgi:hypothetical protein